MSDKPGPKRMQRKGIVIYELAQNEKEAQELADAGFGYGTQESAEKARQAPEIDNYYRNLMKVYAIEVKP